VFSPKLFEIIPENEYFGVDTLIKAMLARNLRIGKYDLTEYWIDIGQVPDYEKAQKDYQLYFGGSEE
jgi:NDP-sugar pyrophosphorylase family protein